MTKHRPQPKSKTTADGPGDRDKHTTPAGTPGLSPAAPAVPGRRSTYFAAVAVYERGLEALQRHDYRIALERFESVLRLYPEEKELHVRVRLSLNICHRHAAPRESTPQTIEERLYASTLAIGESVCLHTALPPSHAATWSV